MSGTLHRVFAATEPQIWKYETAEESGSVLPSSRELVDIHDGSVGLSEPASDRTLAACTPASMTTAVSKCSICNSMRRLRFESGEMTQSTLASRIGLTRQTIGAIERGQRSPSLLAAFRIAAALNATVSDVFHYEPDLDVGSIDE